ncbi:START-like domain-containing protein [Bernardetia sp. Wsw4-3y2]|uniref:START-like domain-containing protein n=1 Tax=Bernardetia sp. Wsw4-3y2 TaxID=3127471 RepID=UPI0030D216B1
MSKYEYNAEYEIRAAVKMVYPFISTPQGLEEWFADRVEVLNDKFLNIHWDNEQHIAKIVSQRNNSMIRYQFVDNIEEEKTKTRGKKKDVNFLELKLNYSELTDTTYLVIKDYSEMNDEEVLEELWDGLVETLREKLGA